jgi:hypothetical protein
MSDLICPLSMAREKEPKKCLHQICAAYEQNEYEKMENAQKIIVVVERCLMINDTWREKI